MRIFFRDTLDFRLVSPNGREKSVGANEDERVVMGVDQVGLHWLRNGATKGAIGCNPE